MKTVILIPARYASTRFPGKPLAMLAGKPIIQHTYTQAAKTGFPVYVATDDDRIALAVKGFGGNYIMTSPNHESGTDRLAEAASNLPEMPDIVINVQGDEPFIQPEQIQSLANCFNDPNCRIATLIQPFDKAKGFEALFDPNKVKVCTDEEGRALYFSRSIIPYVRGVEWQQWLDNASFYTHIGMYGYRCQTLMEITRLPQSSLEKAEKLEQLRWLQAGIPIQTAISLSSNIGIDTPDDLTAAEAYLNSLRGLF